MTETPAPVTTQPADDAGCTLETFEGRAIPAEPGELGPRELVLTCRAHGWTATVDPAGKTQEELEDRSAAVVAAHRASLTGRVLPVEAGALVVEVRDPSLYAHEDLVEGLRRAAGARTVIGIDPDALHLYVTPGPEAVEALHASFRRANVSRHKAGAVLAYLADQGFYLVGVGRAAGSAGAGG